jgi:LDH2 family malate/lactate/ureidoglycolate dehydrogenase
VSATVVTLHAHVVEDALQRLFVCAGLGDADAKTMASALVEADLQRLPSHGLLQAPMYLRRLQCGSISVASRGEIVTDTDAIAVIEAAGMFGHLVGDQAMALAVDRAKRFGAGVVAVRNSFHFGVTGRYARQAMTEDCIGIAMCNTRPLMPAPGGADPLVGNNPLAIGIPASTKPDFLLDMALSEVALGKIRLAAAAGQAIPSTWAVDAEGQATTDPTAALSGMLLPAGGAKGFGLALAIDMMASLLSGGPGGDEIGPMYGDLSKPFLCSLLFIAVDIAHFCAPSDFEARAGRALDRIRAGRSVDGHPLHTPGARRPVYAEGEDPSLALPRELIEDLNRLSSEFGAGVILGV